MKKTQENISLKKMIAFVLARGMPAVINFMAMIFYAHKLAPAAYGEYSLCLFWSSVLASLLFSWLLAALLRFFEEKKNDQDVFLYTLSKTFFLISLVLIVISLLIYWWLHELILFIVILTISQSFFQMCLRLLVLQVKAWRYAVTSTFNAALGFMLAFVFIKCGWGVFGIVMAMALANIITAAKTYFQDWHFSFRPAFSLTMIKTSFSYGFPLTISAIVGVMLYGLDRVMLAHFYDKTSVGLYSLPFNLADQTITLLFMTFQIYLYPLVLRNLQANGEESACQCLQENGHIFLIMLMPVMLVLICFSSWIGQLVTGVEYRTAFSQVLPLIAVSALLGGLKAYYFDLAFQLSKNTLFQLYINGVVLVVNFVLNLLLIPRYSYMGAAYASVFTCAIGVLLSHFIGRRVFKVPSLVSLKNCKIFVSAAVMALLFYHINKLSSGYYMILFSGAIILLYFLLVLPMNQLLFLKKGLKLLEKTN